MRPEQNGKWWRQGRWVPVALLGVYLFSIAVIFYYVTLPEPRYIRPHTADDWAAWGTWIGGIAGTVALVFAAGQIRQQAAATNNATRDSARLDLEARNRQRRESVAQANAVIAASRTTDIRGDEVEGRVQVSNPTGAPLRHVRVQFQGSVSSVSNSDEKDQWGYWLRMLPSSLERSGSPYWIIGTMHAGQVLSVAVTLRYGREELPDIGDSLGVTLHFSDLNGNTWATDEDEYPAYMGPVDGFEETATQLAF